MGMEKVTSIFRKWDVLYKNGLFGGVSRAFKHISEIVPACSALLGGTEDFSLVVWRGVQPQRGKSHVERIRLEARHPE